MWVGRMPGPFQAIFDLVGNGLDLPRIGPAAHHKIVGECSRPFFQFQNGDFFCLLFLAGADGFGDLVRFIISALVVGSWSLVAGQSIVAEVPDHRRQPLLWPRTNDRGRTNDDFLNDYDRRLRAYSPSFFMYSATAGSSNLPSGLLRAIRLPESLWPTQSDARPPADATVAPVSTRSPLAGCLTKGLVTAAEAAILSGRALATSAREYPGPAGHNEFTFAKQRLGLVPLAQMSRRRQSRSEKIGGRSSSAILSDAAPCQCCNSPPARRLSPAAFAPRSRNRNHSGRFQQRRHKRLLARGGQRHHGIAVKKWSHRSGSACGAEHWPAQSGSGPGRKRSLRRPGQGHVPVVDGIERPAQEDRYSWVWRRRPNA